MISSTRIWKTVTLAAALLAGTAVQAQEVVKIGLITPLTGAFASTGQEMQAAAKLYMEQHGDMVAGKKIELIIRDDGNVPDTTKRIAQELVVNDHVAVLTGMGLTPLAFAAAPVATQAKVPPVVHPENPAEVLEQKVSVPENKMAQINGKGGMNLKQVEETCKVMIDVGANVGYYTALFSKLCKSVLAVEPNGHISHLLERTCTVNGLDNVKVTAVAAWL
jgi:hypothetical protein